MDKRHPVRWIEDDTDQAARVAYTAASQDAPTVALVAEGSRYGFAGMPTHDDQIAWSITAPHADEAGALALLAEAKASPWA